MSDTKPGRGSDQFPLRLPDGMRDRIKRAADANGRSMNAEIIAALEQAFPAPISDDDVAWMDAFIRRMNGASKEDWYRWQRLKETVQQSMKKKKPD